MVHIMDKQVERINPLFQPFFQHLPVPVVDDSGNDVKGQDLFSALFAAVDGKGIPQLEQRGFSGPLFVQQVFFRQGLDFIDQQFRTGAGDIVLIEQFVIKSLGLVI